MSLATFRGEGEGESGLERYKFKFRKDRPFLRRNVYWSQQLLTMGSTISSLAGALAPAKSVEEPLVPSEDEEGEQIRPAKRRKTCTFNPPTLAPRFPSESPRRKPFGHVTNESRRAQSRLAGKLQAVQPSAFYGKSGSAAPVVSATAKSKYSGLKSNDVQGFRIDSFLPANPIDFNGALQIEVMGIERKYGDDEEMLEYQEAYDGPLDIECRCTVMLFYENKTESTVPQFEGFSELYRHSRICTLRTTLTDDGGIKRELLMLRPFYISAQELFVDRERSGPQGKMQPYCGWADKYQVHVVLKPKSFQKHWPPFDITPSSDSSIVSDLVSTGKALKKDTFLFCKMQKFLNPEYQNRATDLQICWGTNRQKVPFGLRIQFKWSLPSLLSDFPTRTPQTESPHNLHLGNPATAVPTSPLAVRGEDISAANSPANERAHRKRSNVPTTYNLKALSAQAQGKSPRAPRRIRSKSDLADCGISVIYCLGKADASEFGTRQQTTVTGLLCPFCTCEKGSLTDLLAHLQEEHTSFRFHLRGTLSKPRIFVELAKLITRSDPAFERFRTFQMGKPQTLFNLEKYINGDPSWARFREGPQHHQWPEHLRDRSHESSSSPYESRHSSPNTSNDTDGMWECENHPTKLPTRTRKVFYVPKLETDKHLYDSITKQVLKAGEEIPSSDDEKDEGWLHQKHRDIILDFSDVTEAEKDYIIKWNPFIMEAQLTSEKYLPEAVLRFAEENTDWFLKRKSRKAEFGKHMETFVMRGVMTQESFSQAVDILRQAEKIEAEKGDVNMDNEEANPISPVKQRGMLDCICGEHTQPPDRIICRGPHCKGRFFHRRCAEESGRPIFGTWFCDHCVS